MALVWTVVGVVRMLDVSADGRSAAEATTAGATPTADAEDRTRRTKRDKRQAARWARLAATGKTKAAAEPALPQPTGPCADSDVVVTPTVPDGHAGGPVKVLLELSTLRSAACTWQVDPESVFVTITNLPGTTTLWSSQHCPRALPTKTLVPRRETPARARFFWSGKESQAGCTVATDWVFPGSYAVHAVARGSVNAVDTSFVLGSAVVPSAGPEQPSTRRERRQERRDARLLSAQDDSRDAAEEPEDSRRTTPESDVPAAESKAQREAREQRRRDALREARREHRQDRQDR